MEELLEQHPVGLDPQERFAEMDKDRYMEHAIGVEVEVLDTVIIKKTLEEVARWSANPRSTNRANIGISSGFFSIGYGSPAAARHMSTSFSRRNPLFSNANRSSVFILDFFHSLFGFGRGGDTGGVDPPADPAASSRDLFFPTAVFMLFDGEGFILQVQQVFTRIRSGAASVATGGGARGSTISGAVEMCTGGGLLARSASSGCKCGR
jgi:hypothetical protein